MNPTLSVIIVNYNTGEELGRCLSSVADELVGVAWEGIVVDNGSTDGSDEAVARFAPRVTLLRSPENLGFGRAINQGVTMTSAPLVLLLNPDARLLPGAIEPLVADLRRHPECAVIGPAIINQDGSPQGSARGDPDIATGLFGRSTLLTRLFPNSPLARRNVLVAPEPEPGESSVEVDWVSGACMLGRRQAFDRVGGFDERFFLYWEDADLCRRLRGAGFTIRYRPGAHVVHSVGRSSQTVGPLAIRAFHRSAYLYYTIHVAPSPWHPSRWLALVLLRARCWWALWRSAAR